MDSKFHFGWWWMLNVTRLFICSFTESINNLTCYYNESLYFSVRSLCAGRTWARVRAVSVMLSMILMIVNDFGSRLWPLYVDKFFSSLSYLWSHHIPMFSFCQFQILDDEISADFYVAVPEMLSKLAPLKNKLRKKFPKSKRGNTSLIFAIHRFIQTSGLILIAVLQLLFGIPNTPDVFLSLFSVTLRFSGGQHFQNAGSVQDGTRIYGRERLLHPDANSYGMKTHYIKLWLMMSVNKPSEIGWILT